MSFLDCLERTLVEREFSPDNRAKLAKSGAAMPDGSFPIENEEDLHNAVQSIGRAKNPAAARAHIKKRSAELGCKGCLPKTWEESASEHTIFTNVEQLQEAATTYQPSTGTLTITVIKPGWSKNNRYYPAALLKSSANIFEGCKMFVDHQTDREMSARPEGSINNWVANITKVWPESDGTVKATAKVIDPQFKTKLALLGESGMLNTMGVSIRAMGKSAPGEAEGRKGNVVESLTKAASVDFVTFAGAGGRVDSMNESVDHNGTHDYRPTLETLRERQYQSFLASGMSEADARSMADMCGKPR